jgi:hypothetical protein
MTPREQRKETRLAVEANRALDRADQAVRRLVEFRKKFREAAEVADIQVSVRINGWPEEESEKVARALWGRGLSAMQARQMFASTRARLLQ